MSRLCFPVTCLGESGYVDFLFMLNESNNISVFQICHKFVRDSVLGAIFVKVSMTVRLGQIKGSFSWARTEYC